MDTKRFTIYFTSDLHGYIYPTDYRSRQERDLGLFKCASRFRKDGNTLVIDGGDILQGSPLGAYCHDTLGDASRFAEMMNRCGYDYVTLGNHDFNYGMTYLDSYLNALHARCVCENVRWDGARVRFPARIHTLENGLRIGIVGIVTDYVNIWEKPEHLSGITISDPLPAARAALETLKDQVDVTLCIYHGGFERDLATGRVLSATHENVAYRLCQELDFDLLLTGHQHMTVHGQWCSPPTGDRNSCTSRRLYPKRASASPVRQSPRPVRAAGNGWTSSPAWSAAPRTGWIRWWAICRSRCCRTRRCTWRPEAAAFPTCSTRCSSGPAARSCPPPVWPTTRRGFPAWCGGAIC